jgi:AraC-like DNA-binding protein
MNFDTSRVKSLVWTTLRGTRRIGDIADRLHISQETLRKAFRREEGIPLSTFIARARVEQAKRLLVDSELRCFEICYQVGYSREDVGARAFKRATGMTMLQYRRSGRRATHRTRLHANFSVARA